VVVALIVRGIVTVWIVSWLTLIADGLYLDKYVSRTCYGVDVYYTSTCKEDIADSQRYPQNLYLNNVEDIIGVQV